MSVKGIALPGAVAQIVVATALGAGAAHLWGWSLGGGIVFGLALSVASTVVLLRALEQQGTLNRRTAASRWAGSSSRICDGAGPGAAAGAGAGPGGEAPAGHGAPPGELWQTLASPWAKWRCSWC